MGVLAFSASNALASTSSPAPVYTSNGCGVEVVFVSNTQAYAYAEATQAPCNYSFQVRYEPGGGTAVLTSGTVQVGSPWESADDYTHNSVTELRICANSEGGPTVCTVWAY